MSALFKCILGICVVLCFVQLIEMTRVARDDAAVKDPTDDLINNLQNLVGDVVNKLKTAVDGEQVKKLLDDAGKILADTAKAATSKIEELSKNAEKTPDKN